MWECVPFWVEAYSFADWICGDALTFEKKQIRLLIEIEGMRYILSWNRFVCWLSMRGCVNFWVEANSFADWDWGDSLPFEKKKIRLLIEYVWMLLFWVEADSFVDWDWGDLLPFEMKKIRLLIEYVGMRSLLSGIRFVSWLRLRGFVTFWVEANSFADWLCGDAFPFK